jgi:LysR family nitrogen assimilation transcriptional regulator
MDVRQLKYFVAVVNKGSFTKAAELLGIAQPSLGMQIRNLEEELRSQLLVRTSRGVELTKSGRILFEGARKLISSMSDLQKSISDTAEEPQGTVTFGITPSLADHLLIPLIEQCRQRFPGIKLSVTEDMSYTIVELIEIGQLDLALTFSFKPARGLSIHPLATEGICLLMRADGDKVDSTPLEFRALESLPMILPRRPNRLRVMAEEGALRCNIKLNIAFEMQSLPTILRLVEHGYGATLIAATGSAQRASGGRLVSRPLVNPSLQHNVSLVHLDSKPLSRAELAVAGILKELAAKTWAPADRTRRSRLRRPTKTL